MQRRQRGLVWEERYKAMNLDSPPHRARLGMMTPARELSSGFSVSSCEHVFISATTISITGLKDSRQRNEYYSYR